jgi:hypothetical protein
MGAFVLETLPKPGSVFFAIGLAGVISRLLPFKAGRAVGAAGAPVAEDPSPFRIYVTNEVSGDLTVIGSNGSKATWPNSRHVAT